jgi:hypothetical protein
MIINLFHSPGLVYKPMRGLMTNSIDRDQWRTPLDHVVDGIDGVADLLEDV